MKKFEPHELFCSICLIHESFFNNIGERMDEECPRCGNTRCTRYNDLTSEQKEIAEKNYITKKKFKSIRSNYYVA